MLGKENVIVHGNEDIKLLSRHLCCECTVSVITGTTWNVLKIQLLNDNLRVITHLEYELKYPFIEKVVIDLKFRTHVFIY